MLHLRASKQAIDDLAMGFKLWREVEAGRHSVACGGGEGGHLIMLVPGNKADGMHQGTMNPAILSRIAREA